MTSSWSGSICASVYRKMAGTHKLTSSDGVHCKGMFHSITLTARNFHIIPYSNLANLRVMLCYGIEVRTQYFSSVHRTVYYIFLAFTFSSRLSMHYSACRLITQGYWIGYDIIYMCIKPFIPAFRENPPSCIYSDFPILMSLRWQSKHWQNTQEYPACLSISIAYLNLLNPLPALIENLYFLPFRDIVSFRFFVLWPFYPIPSLRIAWMGKVSTKQKHWLPPNWWTLKTWI